MRFFDLPTSEKWLATYAVGADVSLARAPVCFDRGVIENDPPRSLYGVMRTGVRYVGHDPRVEMMLLVREHGIWSEELQVYGMIRERFGCFASVEELPGHLAEHHERELVVSLGVSALSNGWGIVLAARESGRAMHVNHDGRLWFTSVVANDFGELERAFAGMPKKGESVP